MNAVKEYIESIIGLQVNFGPLPEQDKQKLPLYLLEGFIWYTGEIAQKDCAFAKPLNEKTISIATTALQIGKAESILKKPVILVFQTLEAYQRKRLIEKRAGFVLPGKQLYIPEFLIDLRDINFLEQVKNTQLTPIAQVIVLHHLLHKKSKIEGLTYQQIAAILFTNPMAITRAVRNLNTLGLIEIHGEKEKYFYFKNTIKELWNIAMQQNFFVNPVLKTVFVDEKPKDLHLLKTNASALPIYTDLNPGRQQYFAIEKTAFYDLHKNNILVNMNEFEGDYALEVWKYNPTTLVGEIPGNLEVVDPISLYLNLKDSSDERVEMALEQIIEKYIW